MKPVVKILLSVLVLAFGISLLYQTFLVGHYYASAGLFLTVIVGLVSPTIIIAGTGLILYVIWIRRRTVPETSVKAEPPQE